MNTRLISCQRKRKKKWSYKYGFNPVAHHRLRDLHTVFYEFGCNCLCSEILREALALAKSKKLLSHAPWRPEAGIIDLAIGRPAPWRSAHLHHQQMSQALREHPKHLVSSNSHLSLY